MADRLFLVGAGGHCLSCIEVIESQAKFVIAGILDLQVPAGNNLLNYPVLGNDRLIAELAADPSHSFLVTVGQIKSASVRMKLAKQIKDSGGRFATIADAGARIARSSQLGEGTIAMQQVIINSNCRIGEQVILNNKCLVEHESVIGDFCHISTGAIVNGACSIGSRVFIGSGAVCVNNISVVDDVIIGAGSLVKKSITEPGVYTGNPARKISNLHA